jgi:DNA-binding IclR family transcriptional regulator
VAQVPAAAQALAVLSYLGRQATPARASSIAREVGLPRSTTYHLLDTLVSAGYVVHVPEQQRYGLGVASYELGAGYTRQAPLARLARAPLEALVRRTGHNGHLVVLDGRDCVYVIEERAPGRPPLVTDVGVRLPAHLTASGRALLAALPAAQIRALYPDATALTYRDGAPGPRSPSALRALLVDVRRRGYAVEDGEVTPGFASVAMAALDHREHPVAALAVTYPVPGTEPAEVAVLAGHVRRAARETSRRLGAVALRPPAPRDGRPVAGR